MFLETARRIVSLSVKLSEKLAAGSTSSYLRSVTAVPVSAGSVPYWPGSPLKSCVTLRSVRIPRTPTLPLYDMLPMSPLKSACRKAAVSFIRTAQVIPGAGCVVAPGYNDFQNARGLSMAFGLIAQKLIPDPSRSVYFCQLSESGAGVFGICCAENGPARKDPCELPAVHQVPLSLPLKITSA